MQLALYRPDGLILGVYDRVEDAELNRAAACERTGLACDLAPVPEGLPTYAAWFDGEGVALRPELSLAVPGAVEVGETLTLGLPAGAVLTLNGEPVEGPAVTFAAPGAYDLKVVAWPYLDFTATVEAL
jgi:hypothetical protein